MPSFARIGWITPAFAALFATVGHMDSAWADLKDFGNRLEGTLNRGFTEGDVELVSFTGSSINYSMDITATLDVWFFGSAAGLTIRAKELSPGLFYSMESKPGKWTAGAWNNLGPWSTKDMLIPLGVQPSNLGVVVWLDKPRGLVAPAFVGASPNAASPVRYTVVLRTTKPGSLEFWLYKQGSNDALLTGKRGPFEKDVPQRIELPIDGAVSDGEPLELVIQPTFDKTLPPASTYTFVYTKGRSK